MKRLAFLLVLLTGVAGAVAGLIVVAPLRQAATDRPVPVTARHATGSTAKPAPFAMAAIPTPTPGASPIPATPSAAPSPAPSFAPPPTRAEALRPVSQTRYSDERIGCDEEDGGYAACSRAEVIAADRDLRIAYGRAIDAGVDRARLVAIRNRWARLRATDYDRPAALLAGYAELADRLYRAADDADADGDLR